MKYNLQKIMQEKKRKDKKNHNELLYGNLKNQSKTSIFERNLKETVGVCKRQNYFSFFFPKIAGNNISCHCWQIITVKVQCHSRETKAL